MIDSIVSANSWLNALVWGPPMLILLMGTGVLLLFVTGAVQFRHPRHRAGRGAWQAAIPLLRRLHKEFFELREQRLNGAGLLVLTSDHSTVSTARAARLDTLARSGEPRYELRTARCP